MKRAPWTLTPAGFGDVARVDRLLASPMAFPDRPMLSRRFLHYLILVALGNGLLGAVVLFY